MYRSLHFPSRCLVVLLHKQMQSRPHAKNLYVKSVVLFALIYLQKRNNFVTIAKAVFFYVCPRVLASIFAYMSDAFSSED